MLCFLTARKLKPGTFEDFRSAWEPDDWDPRFVRAYHVRNLNDENQVVSFGFFDATADEYRAMRRDREDARVERMSEYIEQILVDGVYEVVDEVEPPR